MLTEPYFSCSILIQNGLYKTVNHLGGGGRRNRRPRLDPPQAGIIIPNSGVPKNLRLQAGGGGGGVINVSKTFWLNFALNKGLWLFCFYFCLFGGGGGASGPGAPPRYPTPSLPYPTHFLSDLKNFGSLFQTQSRGTHWRPYITNLSDKPPPPPPKKKKKKKKKNGQSRGMHPCSLNYCFFAIFSSIFGVHEKFQGVLCTPWFFFPRGCCIAAAIYIHELINNISTCWMFVYWQYLFSASVL